MTLNLLHLRLLVELSIFLFRVILKTEMAEGEFAAVIGPTRHPASRVASPFRCDRCEPESLVEPSTTPSSFLSIPVSRVIAVRKPAETSANSLRTPTREGRETPPPEPTPLQRHLQGTLTANLQDMPEVSCNYGCKKNSLGNTDYWRGYKLHLVTGDGDLPMCAYLSSASMQDSQAAIILEQGVAQRTVAMFYPLKDSAYDAQAILEHSAAKVMTHLMFGILVMSAEALIRQVI
jgi:hypothetical protein